MKVRVKKFSQDAILPSRKRNSDAGFDLYCMNSAEMYPNATYMLDTGVAVEIPEGYVGFIKERSGLGCEGIQVLGGVIDEGYIGEIKVLLLNNAASPKKIKVGDRIAQLVILPIPEIELVEVEELSETDRGDSGFGASGR